jgi:NAD(P)-dependent dehydrogenase (short-subunit alcohol dehydrogenase family)
MEMAGAGVVITGAGRGIGAAMARRFAAGGARVVVNDLDAAAAEQVAAEVGGLAVPGDAATDAGAGALVARARDHLGEIDLFCANAGVAVGGGPEAPDAGWELSFQVNVMAHVYAARHLLPAWLDRGSGRFLATVSAAGLLTMLGSAPYAVSKHAALAFAEWLSITYRDRGIVTQALCPQGVRTDMLDQTTGAARALLDPAAIEPSEVADTVAEALATTDFLILPHPEVASWYAHRAADPDRWQASLRHHWQTLQPSD